MRVPDPAMVGRRLTRQSRKDATNSFSIPRPGWPCFRAGGPMTAMFKNQPWRPEWLQRLRAGRGANIRLAALLVSLLLHGLVFWWGMNSARFGTPSQEKIQAIRVFLQPMELPALAAPPRPLTNEAPPADKPAALPAAITPPRAAATPTPPASPSPAASPAPVVAITPAPVPGLPVAVSLAPLPVAAAPDTLAGPPTAATGGMTTSPAAPTTGAAAAQVGPIGSGAATGAAGQVTGGSSTGSGLTLYKQRLFAHIDAHKIYPPSARRRQIEGQVRVSFTIEPGGALSDLKVTEGHPQLEAAARQTLQSALPLPLPANGVELPFNFSFRMDFRLR